MDSSKDSSGGLLPSFTKFSLFPKEVQFEIWFQALPEDQLVYHDPDGPFPLPKPHALYFVCLDSREVYLKHHKKFYTHDSTCHLSAKKQSTCYFNPTKDTLVYTHPNNLVLSHTFTCCRKHKANIAEFRRVALLADRRDYYRPRMLFARRNIYVIGGDMSSPYAALQKARSGKFIYEQFLTRHPAVESVSYVFGCETVRETAENFPEMRLVKSMEESEGNEQGGHRVLMEFSYTRTISDIRYGFEDWKEIHPEVNIPQVEMVFATSKENSEKDDDYKMRASDPPPRIQS